MNEQGGSMTANQKSCDVCPILHRRIADLEQEVETRKGMYQDVIDALNDAGAARVDEDGDTLVSSNRIRALAAERDNLKAQLAALDWRPITGENLPTVGDELIRRKCGDIERIKYGAPPHTHALTAFCDFSNTTAEEFNAWGWTHFRPIGAPDAKK